MSHLFCAAPLKVAKPFPQPDGSLHVCLMDCSPGLLAGDCYDLEWHLEPGAQVKITHQGFMRVHPSQDAPCRHHQSIAVASDALLEYEAAPILLYRDAALRAETGIVVERGGTLILSEILCAGRTGRDESFAFHTYEGRLRARYAGELVAWNAADLRPQSHNLRARGAWDGNTHWGSVLVVAEKSDKQLQEALRSELRDIEAEVESGKTAVLTGGVGLAERHAITISLLGRRAWDVERAARRLRSVARRAALSFSENSNPGRTTA